MKAVRESAGRVLGEVLGCERLGAALEKHVFNHTLRVARTRGFPRNWRCKRFRFWYLSKVRQLRYNLRKYETLRTRVITHELTLQSVCAFRPAELRLGAPMMADESAATSASASATTTRQERLANTPDGAFVCRRCKSKKTTYYEMQTRSADEPMTIFVTCLNCENRWRG